MAKAKPIPKECDMRHWKRRRRRRRRRTILPLAPRKSKVSYTPVKYSTPKKRSEYYVAVVYLGYSPVVDGAIEKLARRHGGLSVAGGVLLAIPKRDLDFKFDNPLGLAGFTKDVEKMPALKDRLLEVRTREILVSTFRSVRRRPAKKKKKGK